MNPSPQGKGCSLMSREGPDPGLLRVATTKSIRNLEGKGRSSEKEKNYLPNAMDGGSGSTFTLDLNVMAKCRTAVGQYQS